jgi:hypothetical protein
MFVQLLNPHTLLSVHLLAVRPQISNQAMWGNKVIGGGVKMRSDIVYTRISSYRSGSGKWKPFSGKKYIFSSIADRKCIVMWS